jgi:FMN reductase
MSKILLINGSPTERSRSQALLNHAANVLNDLGIETKFFGLRDFPAEDLVLAKYESESFDGWKREVAAANGIIISTPLYKATFTGGLKTLLDVLPQGAFRGKTLLPIATGGSAGHLLALDFAIKPVLATLGASDIHQGVFITDAQFPRVATDKYVLDPELRSRLDEAIQALVRTTRETSAVA